jgi:hypothetical protein
MKLKLMYKHNTISNKISTSCFVDTDMTNLNFTWKDNKNYSRNGRRGDKGEWWRG